MRSGVMKKAALVALALALAAAASAGEEPVVPQKVPRESDFVKLGPPKPGEWRYVFPEPVQTFEEYATQHGREVPGEPRSISVVPLGRQTETLDEEALRLLEEFLATYFMTKTELEPARDLPDAVRRRPSRGFGTQVLADDVLRLMAEDEVHRAAEEPCLFTWRPFCVAWLGIVQTDLYGSSPDGGYLNFVFGMGAYANRVAVISPARYSIRYEGEPEGITPRKRVFKVAAHELGHVFGLAHCQKYGCCMNGSNSLPEADRRPIHLCPECLEKLAWRLDFFDSGLRYRALSKVYLKLGWREEADFAARRAMLDPGILAPAEKDAGVADSKGTEQQ